MKILKILVACFAVLVLSAFFVFELIFLRSVDNSLSAYAEENITSDSVEPLSGDDPDPSIIDYHWDLSGFEQYNLNLFDSSLFIFSGNGIVITNDSSIITINGTATSLITTYSFANIVLPQGNYSIVIYSNQSIDSSLLRCDMRSSSGSQSSNFFVIASTYNFYNFTVNTVENIFNIRIGNTGTAINNLQLKIMLVKGTYTAETMPAYQPNLKYIFSSAFTYGYQDGYDTGYDSGRNYGYNFDYVSGYDTGYSYGRNSQISEGLFKNPLEVFLQPISNFLNTDIFGSFSIGDGFTIAFFVMIALIFIKMFAGG